MNSFYPSKIMKDYNSLQESDFLNTKKRLEERLKIIKAQREAIKRNNQNRLKKLVFFILLFTISIATFYAYQSYCKNIYSKQQNLNNKVSFLKEQKFRDSINLLAMNIEVENRAYKKIEDSIQLEVDKKWYAIISDTSYQGINKESFIKRKKTNKKKHLNNTLISSLKSKNQQKHIKSDNSSSLEIKETKPKKIIKEKKTDNIVHVFAVFPGCESKQNKLSCFNTKIDRYIRKHINKKVFKKSGVGQVHVLFTISINGLVKIIKITGAINEVIKNETIRVVESLPRFKAALNKDNSSIPAFYHLTIDI